MDTVDDVTRSRMMSGIKSHHTKPELVIRSMLHGDGFRFRLHHKGLPGKPDLVLAKYRTAIFVHGCFWHVHEGCHYFKWPSTRVEFWAQKLKANQNRDKHKAEQILDMGWRVMIVWECATRDKSHHPELLNHMRDWLNQPEQGNYIEFPAAPCIKPLAVSERP